MNDSTPAFSVTSGVVPVATIDVNQLPQSMYDFVISYKGGAAGTFHELGDLLDDADYVGRDGPRQAGLRGRLEDDLRKEGIDPRVFTLVLIWK